MKIFEFEQLSSTNDYAKKHLEEGDCIIISKAQTLGRGSNGRSFSSATGGLYLTKMKHNLDLPASRVFEIMINASVAVCKSMEEFSLQPTIKWPNDVYVDEKKICGILIENTFLGNLISRSIVGIGINVNNTLPPELSKIAVTMSELKGENLNLEKVKNSLIYHLNQNYSIFDYKKYLSFLQQEIKLLQSDGIRKVIAIDVDESGRLIVEENGMRKIITAGEVSLRF